MATPVPHPAPHLTTAGEISQLVLGGPGAWLPLASAALHVLINLAIGAGLLVVTLWAAGWAARLAREAAGRLHHGHGPDAVLQGFVSSLVRYGVIVIGLIAVLQQIGVQTTSVLAVLGAASLAIGLALQGGLSNVAAGVMLLLLRPYRIGDRVKIGEVVGRVNGLDLFVTRLHDLDNSVVFIPNSKAFGDVIINYSMPENRRIVMDFHIDYDDDVELALELLRETARAEPRIVRRAGALGQGHRAGRQRRHRHLARLDLAGRLPRHPLRPDQGGQGRVPARGPQLRLPPSGRGRVAAVESARPRSPGQGSPRPQHRRRHRRATRPGAPPQPARIRGRPRRPVRWTTQWVDRNHPVAPTVGDAEGSGNEVR